MAQTVLPMQDTECRFTNHDAVAVPVPIVAGQESRHTLSVSSRCNVNIDLYRKVEPFTCLQCAFDLISVLLCQSQPESSRHRHARQ